MNRNSLKQQMVEGLITYGFTLYLRVRDHTTSFRRCLGMALGRFLLGSHNSMVTALGSCVKWPSIMSYVMQRERGARVHSTVVTASSAQLIG
jgi:hypothetical protein